VISLYEAISSIYESDSGNPSIILSGLDAFIFPRFIFKGSADCSTFYLDDMTDYNEVVDIDINEVRTNVSLYFKRCCGLECLCPLTSISTNGRLDFDNLRGDGTYVVLIDMSYSYWTVWEGEGDPPVDWEPEYITVFKQIREELSIDCCKAMRENIICTTESKMNGILCEIVKRRNVGRDWCKLMWSLYELSNVRWLMLRSCIDCNDTQLFKCYVDKIKSYDCGMC